MELLLVLMENEKKLIHEKQFQYKCSAAIKKISLVKFLRITPQPLLQELSLPRRSLLWPSQGLAPFRRTWGHPRASRSGR